MDQCIIGNHYAWIGLVLYSILEAYLGKSQVIKPSSLLELVYVLVMTIFRRKE